MFDCGWMVFQREFGEAAVALDNDACFLMLRRALIAQARYANAVSSDPETALVVIDRYRKSLLARYRGVIVQRRIAA